MQPDSLVFLLIVGMWAAFFVQHWVRRREHLATAHAADAFTETMRVLDRRPTAATPTRSSYAVALAARPQDRVAVPAGPATAPAEAQASSAALSSGERSRSAPTDSSGGPLMTSHPGPARGAVRIRATLLLAALLAVPAVAVLASRGTVAWVWVAAPAAVLVLVVAWLRRAATLAAASAARPDRHTSPVSVAAPAQPAASSPASVETTETPAEPESLSAGPREDTAERAKTEVRETEFVDPLAVDTPVAAVVEPEPEPEPVIVYDYKVIVDEDDIPLTWDPVPVPRPVYAMKAKAVRAELAPAETTPGPEEAERRPRRNHEATAYAGQPKRSAHTA